MSNLRYLCLLAYSGVLHTVFFYNYLDIFFLVLCTLCYQFLQIVYFDCFFRILQRLFLFNNCQSYNRRQLLVNSVTTLRYPPDWQTTILFTPITPVCSNMFIKIVTIVLLPSTTPLTNVINPHEMMISLISEPGVVCLWQAGSELLLQVQTIVEIINYWYHYNIFICRYYSQTRFVYP